MNTSIIIVVVIAVAVGIVYMGLRLMLSMSPLQKAIEAGQIEKAKELINQGADLNSPQRVTKATPLFSAAIRNQKDIVELLLEKGADVSSKTSTSTTPLHMVAGFGHVEMAELLISKGAQVNARNYVERTPMHYAIACDVPPLGTAPTLLLKMNMVRLLHSHGADIDAKDKHGITPILLCIQEKSPELVNLLLSEGANPNIQAIDGSSPLHFISYVGDSVQIAESLLAAGANTNLKDRMGQTPLNVAEQKNRPAIVNLLRSKAKTPPKI